MINKKYLGKLGINIKFSTIDETDEVKINGDVEKFTKNG